MTPNYEERVLCLSTQPADAQSVCAVASQAGIAAQRCRDMDELCAGIREGAGAAVLCQKALCHAAFDQLAATLQAQPAWSDLPLIVVAVAGDVLRSRDVLEVTPELGNVVVLQRPLRTATLVTAIRTALRARRRQYEMRRSQELLEEALSRERAQTSELEAIMEAVPAAIIIGRDPECRLITGSRMAYDLLGVPPGSNLAEAAEGDRPTVLKIMRGGRPISGSDWPIRGAAATGKPVTNYELDLEFRDGRSVSVIGSAVPLFGDDGRPRGAVAAVMDITERKHEEQFRQAQKLESVGLLAGGIAHDFNNLLTSIMGNASLMAPEVGPGPARQLEEIALSAERAAHLTKQLLAYSGKGQFMVRDLDVSEAVGQARELVRFSIPKTVDLTVNVKEGLPTVRMDPRQLEQILVNLILNAGEAIGEYQPGRIAIDASLTDIEKPFVDARGEKVAAGRYVSIEVSDTGTGIDEKTKLKIFDPFFTTRFTGRGLGLAAVAGILRSLGGGITVESVPGHGSLFRVLLPLLEPPAEEAGSQPDTKDCKTTILVVDDEAAIRDFIVAVLRREGYCVLTASCGRDALALCERESWKVDAVVLDVVMPRMSAEDLLSALLTRQPKMKILLTTGDESRARRLGSAYPGTAFIAKPYTAQQLAHAVDKLIGLTSGR